MVWPRHPFTCAQASVPTHDVHAVVYHITDLDDYVKDDTASIVRKEYLAHRAKVYGISDVRVQVRACLWWWPEF